MKVFKTIILLLFVSSLLSAQEEILIDSTEQAPLVVEVDSTFVKNKKKKKSLRAFLKKDYPIPKRAMLLSFAIPGAGQAYNKKWWKIPIAIGGTATAVYYVIQNTQDYRFLRDQLRLRYDDTLPIVEDVRLASWTNEDIMNERDRRNKWKESSYIALILIQALGGVDAFVDAHMYRYKINEDLSMKIKPSMESTTGFGPAVGLGLSFQFNTPSTPKPKQLPGF